MPELSRKVDVYVVEYICDCGAHMEAIAQSVAMAFPKTPTHFPHQCTKCKKRVILDKLYPHKKYETVKGGPSEVVQTSGNGKTAQP